MKCKTLIVTVLGGFMAVFNLASCNNDKANIINTAKSVSAISAKTALGLPKVQFIQGWSTERVQRLQQQTAKALDRSVKFNDVVYSNQNETYLNAPTMIVIPAGQYEMGCNKKYKICFPREQPPITVKHSTPFAVSETEISEADWQLCVDDDICKRKGELVDKTWTATHKFPIVNVSWQDAQIYVKWLTKKTKQRYRLLSDSEWEYAAKAGSDDEFNLGNILNCNQEQYKGSKNNACYFTPVHLGSEINEIKQYKANAFGLYDMHGNAWEWVQDCWSNSLLNTSSNGSAYTLKANNKNSKSRCSFFVTRGGSYAGIKRQRQASHYSMGRKSSSYGDQGLRIARNL